MKTCYYVTISQVAGSRARPVVGDTEHRSCRKTCKKAFALQIGPFTCTYIQAVPLYDNLGITVRVRLYYRGIYRKAALKSKDVSYFLLVLFAVTPYEWTVECIVDSASSFGGRTPSTLGCVCTGTGVRYHVSTSVPATRQTRRKIRPPPSATRLCQPVHGALRGSAAPQAGRHCVPPPQRPPSRWSPPRSKRDGPRGRRPRSGARQTR